MKSKFATVLPLFLLLSACALLAPKRPVELYSRPDLETATGKVIVFPLLDFNGAKPRDAAVLDAALLKHWGELYGSGNLVPIGPALSAFASNPSFSGLIKTLNDAGAIEQLHKSRELRQAVAALTARMGDYNLALAITDGGKAAFEGGSEIHLNIGYFDTRNLTWRWITKTAGKKDKLARWELEAANMVADSFKALGPLARAGDAKPAAREKTAPPAQEAAQADPAALMKSAAARFKTGDLPGAKQDYLAAFDLFPQEAAGRVAASERLGAVFLKEGRSAAAKKLFQQAIDLARRHGHKGRPLAEAYYGLGACQEKEGKMKAALASYTRAAALMPDKPRKARIRARIAELKSGGK